MNQRQACHGHSAAGQIQTRQNPSPLRTHWLNASGELLAIMTVVTDRFWCGVGVNGPNKLR